MHGAQQFLEQQVPFGELLRIEDVRQAGAEFELQGFHFLGARLLRQRLHLHVIAVHQQPQRALLGAVETEALLRQHHPVRQTARVIPLLGQRGLADPQ